MVINKEKFIARMAQNGETTKRACREYLELMLDTFYDFMCEGEVVRFKNVLRAEVKTTPERLARNPQNGDVCIVPERKYIKVKISETLRDRFNKENVTDI